MIHKTIQDPEGGHGQPIGGQAVARDHEALGRLVADLCGEMPDPNVAMAPAWNPRAALARAILAMDVESAAKIIAHDGIDLGRSLAEETDPDAPWSPDMQAIELWGIGCRALQASQGAAAEGMLNLLFDAGADLTRLPLRIKPYAARRPNNVTGRDALLAIAADPPFFFDWLDCEPMIDAMAGFMARCEREHGMGRNDWLKGQKIAFGVDGANFGDRPSPSMAICLHRVFGQSFDPEHWLFFARSTQNASFAF